MFSFQTRRFFAALLCVTQEKATQYGAKTAFDEAMVSCEETPKWCFFISLKKLPPDFDLQPMTILSLSIKAGW